MSGYNCYLKYLAIKTHFTQESYDYFKYNGKVKANHNSYQKRTDRYFFEKLSRKLPGLTDIEIFFVSNLVYSSTIWIGDIFTEECYDSYHHVKCYLQNATYKFREDLNSLFENLKTKKELENFLFCGENGKSPELLWKINSGEFAIESFLIVNRELHLLQNWNQNIPETVLWPMLYLKWSKYEPFFIRFLNEEQLAKLKMVFKESVCDWSKSMLIY